MLSQFRCSWLSWWMYQCISIRKGLRHWRYALWMWGTVLYFLLERKELSTLLWYYLHLKWKKRKFLISNIKTFLIFIVHFPILITDFLFSITSNFNNKFSLFDNSFWFSIIYFLFTVRHFPFPMTQYVITNFQSFFFYFF